MYGPTTWFNWFKVRRQLHFVKSKLKTKAMIYWCSNIRLDLTKRGYFGFVIYCHVLEIFLNHFKRVQDQVILHQNVNFTQVCSFSFLLAFIIKIISAPVPSNKSKANFRIFITKYEDCHRIWLYADICKYSGCKHHRYGRKSCR